MTPHLGAVVWDVDSSVRRHRQSRGSERRRTGGFAAFDRHRAIVLSCALLFALVAAAGCEEPTPPAPAVLGVSAAKQSLYPYQFTPNGTFRGTRTLEAYLADHPDGQDRAMAQWLLARTWTDALTRAVTLRASGATVAADQLLTDLAAEVGAEQATLDHIASAIATRVRAIEGTEPDSPLAVELETVLQLLDAIAQRALQTDPPAPASATRVVADLAESEHTVALNARLLLAARTIEIAEHASRVIDGRDVPAALAAQYPFACPDGMRAYATGEDRSLKACDFVCDPARAELERTGANHPTRTLLATACTTRHYGLGDPRDAVMLARPNVVLTKTMSHMSSNLRALDRDLDLDETLLGPLHEGMVERAQKSLAELTLPLSLPVTAPDDHIRLPVTTGLAAPSPDITRSVAITEDGVRVNVAAHLRVDEGNTFIPEVLLRYRHPGRLAVAPTAPFSLGRIDRDRSGRLVGLVEYLVDLEKDRDRIYARHGNTIVGPVPRSAADARKDGRTWLLADVRSTGELFDATLATLYDQGYRDLEIITFDADRLAAGAVPVRLVEPMAKPDTPVVEIGPERVRLAQIGRPLAPVAGADRPAQLAAAANAIEGDAVRVRGSAALGPTELAAFGQALAAPDAPAEDGGEADDPAAATKVRVLLVEIGAVVKPR